MLSLIVRRQRRKRKKISSLVSIALEPLNSFDFNLSFSSFSVSFNLSYARWIASMEFEWVSIFAIESMLKPRQITQRESVIIITSLWLNLEKFVVSSSMFSHIFWVHLRKIISHVNFRIKYFFDSFNFNFYCFRKYYEISSKLSNSIFCQPMQFEFRRLFVKIWSSRESCQLQ